MILSGVVTAEQAPIFHSAKLKIERANKHINDLNNLINSFVASDFYRFHVEVDSNTGDNLLKLEFTDFMPSEGVLILGDAVHNLHSALDLMICEIVLKSGKTPDNATKFPFHGKRQEVIGQINSGKIKAAGPIVRDLIVDMIKPYRGGNDLLYGLHDLDILDKHRLLIVVIAVVSLTGVYAQSDNVVFSNCTMSVEQ